MRYRLPAVPALFGLASLAITLAGCASGQARTLSVMSKPRTIAIVHDSITALAQSKSRLAWLRGSTDCAKAEIYDLHGHRRVKVSSRRSRACPVFSTFGTFAFDGNRILWQGIGDFGTSYTDVLVFSAALNDRRTRVLGDNELGNGGDLQVPLLPMAGGGGRLLFDEECAESCSSSTSDIRTVVGHQSRSLLKAERPVGLAIAGNRLAVLENKVGGADEAGVEMHDVGTGALLRRFVVPGTAIAVAMSPTYVAVVVRDDKTKLELHRYRADGTALDTDRLPPGANGLAVGTKFIVYVTGRRIVAMDGETGSTRIVATTAVEPVGLSILNRRVVWAENLGKKGARVRAIDLRS